MADNQHQEQAAQAQPKEGEKPKETTLDKVVKDVWNGIVNPSIAAGAIGASYGLFGLDGLSAAASFPVGRALVEFARKDGKGKLTTANLRDESIAGALFTPAVMYGIEAVKSIPKTFGLEGMVTNMLSYSVPVAPLVVGAATGLALSPILNALYYPLQYLIQNKKFKGMGEDFKKNYFSGLVKTAPLTALASAAVGVSYAMPVLAPYLFPALAALNIGYRVLLSPEKISAMKLLFSPITLPIYGAYYLAAGAVKTAYSASRGLFKLIYNTFKGAHDTGLAFGNSVAAAAKK
jgi:hypothetical protein